MRVNTSQYTEISSVPTSPKAVQVDLKSNGLAQAALHKLRMRENQNIKNKRGRYECEKQKGDSARQDTDRPTAANWRTACHIKSEQSDLLRTPFGLASNSV